MPVKLRNNLSIVIPIIIAALLGTILFIRFRIDTLQKQVNLLELKLSTLTKEQNHCATMHHLNSIFEELIKLVVDPAWSLLERQQLGNFLQLIATASAKIKPEIKETLKDNQIRIANDINRFFELQNQLIDKLNNQTPVLIQNNIKLFSNIYLPVKISKKIDLPPNHQTNTTIIILIGRLQGLLYMSPQDALKQLSKLKQTINLTAISEIDEFCELFSKYLDTSSIVNNIDVDKI